MAGVHGESEAPIAKSMEFRVTEVVKRVYDDMRVFYVCVEDEYVVGGIQTRCSSPPTLPPMSRPRKQSRD